MLNSSFSSFSRNRFFIGLVCATVLMMSSVQGHAMACSSLGSELQKFDLRLSKKKKDQLLAEIKKTWLTKVQNGTYQENANAFSFMKSRFSSLVTILINRRNPNTYFFHFTRLGFPQKIRFMIKVGVHFDQSPAFLKEYLGVNLNATEIEYQRERLNSSRQGLTLEKSDRSNLYLEEMIQTIQRYESLNHDILLLEIYAKTKKNTLKTLEGIAAKKLNFPLEISVSEKVNQFGELSEVTYQFDSRESLLDQINILKNLDQDKISEKSGSPYLKGRMVEQAELRGILYVYKSELLRYSAAFRHDSLRKKLIDRVQRAYNNPQLMPSKFALSGQYFEELKWEVDRYLGARIDNSDGENATQLLRLNDIVDLGIRENKLGGAEKVRRLFLLSLPLQAMVYSTGFGISLGFKYYHNDLQGGARATVVQQKSEGAYSFELIRYFNEKFDFDISLSKEKWPEEITSEYELIIAERMAFERALRTDSEKASTLLKKDSLVRMTKQSEIQMIELALNGELKLSPKMSAKELELAAAISVAHARISKVEVDSNKIATKLYLEFVAQ